MKNITALFLALFISLASYSQVVYFAFSPVVTLNSWDVQNLQIDYAPTANLQTAGAILSICVKFNSLPRPEIGLHCSLLIL